MLYDQHRSAPAKMLRDDITLEDLKNFCADVDVAFVAMGCPPGCGGTGWEDPSVFRAATQAWPQVGVTVPLDKVLSWKLAVQATEERVLHDGVYRHYKGGRVVTQGEVQQESDGKRAVLYRDEAGKSWVCPTDKFFSVVHHEGALLPRYTLEEVDVPLTPIPHQGVLMTAAQYDKAWSARELLPTEGRGYWATERLVSQVNALARQPFWATHVVWFHY